MLAPIHIIPAGELVCDFCTGTPVVKRYGCQSFDILAGRSVGDWAACARCRDFIDAGDWNALVDYVLEKFAKNHPGAAPPRAVARAYLLDLYSTFRKNRREKLGAEEN